LISENKAGIPKNIFKILSENKAGILKEYSMMLTIKVKLKKRFSSQRLGLMTATIKVKLKKRFSSQALGLMIPVTGCVPFLPVDDVCCSC